MELLSLLAGRWMKATNAPFLEHMPVMVMLQN